MMESTKENRYTVIKNEDLVDSLTEAERQIFNLLLNKAIVGKPSRKYYVVNKDEPYAHKILEVILDGEESKGADYHEKILALLREHITLEYSQEVQDESINKVEFNFISFPLLGNLENEIQPTLTTILQKLQTLNATKWRLGNLERFRDLYSFQDVYIGEIIIEQEEKTNSMEL
jgi:hypothetical protein